MPTVGSSQGGTLTNTGGETTAWMQTASNYPTGWIGVFGYQIDSNPPSFPYSGIPDPNPLPVISTDPANGAQGVSTSLSQITITFPYELPANFAAIAAASFTAEIGPPGNSFPIPTITAAVSTSGCSLILTPQSQLAPGTLYAVAIFPDSSLVAGEIPGYPSASYGYPFSQFYMFTFTTQPAPITGLALTSCTDATASFSFPAPADATAVALEQSIDGGSTWTGSATTGTLTASSTAATATGLAPDTQYLFKLAVTGGENAGDSNMVDVTTQSSGGLTFTPGSGIITPATEIAIAPTGVGQAVYWNETAPPPQPGDELYDPSAGIYLTVSGTVYTAVYDSSSASWSDQSSATYTVTTPLQSVSVSGTPQVGDTLTVNLTPPGATATYQWEESATASGVYTAIYGATSTTYAPVVGDVGDCIEVVATGNGGYSGTVTSTAAGPVQAAVQPPIPLQSVSVSGTPQVGDTLTANVRPSGATATYQWYEGTSKGSWDNGTWSLIAGATGSTYTLVRGDEGYYFNVVATGTGGQYTQPDFVGPVAPAPPPGPLQSVSISGGTPQAGDTLMANLTPSGATASYQWEESTSATGTYADIPNATSNFYTPVTGDVGDYIKVVATGNGGYSGIVTSAAAGPVQAQPTIPIPWVSISGTPQAGDTLTAGFYLSGATVTYQWKESTSATGTYADIPNATSNTYSPVAGDVGDCIRVTVTGTGNYSGTVTSPAIGPIQAAGSTTPLQYVSVSGTLQVGDALTANCFLPGVTATYQWLESTSATGTYSDITNATSGAYTPVAGDVGDYIEVQATGTGNYSGTATSAAAGPVMAASGSTTPLQSVSISGTLQAGDALTASMTPSGATATYQWLESTSATGTYSDITNATSGAYTPVAGDVGDYIEVQATGTGNYSGTATSAAAGPVMAASGSTGGSHPSGGGGNATPVNNNGTGTLSTGGGTVWLGNEAGVTIPEGTLQGTSNVNVTIQQVSSPPTAPQGESIVGAYEFTVGGQIGFTFNNPVTLTFSFDPSKIPSGAAPALYYYDNTAKQWVNAGGRGELDERHDHLPDNHDCLRVRRDGRDTAAGIPRLYRCFLVLLGIRRHHEPLQPGDRLRLSGRNI